MGESERRKNHEINYVMPRLHDAGTGFNNCCVMKKLSHSDIIVVLKSFQLCGCELTGEEYFYVLRWREQVDVDAKHVGWQTKGEGGDQDDSRGDTSHSDLLLLASHNTNRYFHQIFSFSFLNFSEILQRTFFYSALLLLILLLVVLPQ